jgi:dihydrofolate reductase
MILSHIVAASENSVIGKEGGLPWSIPEDMKFFKDKTKGKIIIMGRKTYESVGHPLPNRLNVVVTRQPGYKAEGGIVFTNVAAAIEYAKTRVKDFDPEIFIIGGGEIYKETLSIVDRIYLTRIHKKIDGDTYYPEVPTKVFSLVDQSDRTEPVPFSFLTYERQK